MLGSKWGGFNITSEMLNQGALYLCLTDDAVIKEDDFTRRRWVTDDTPRAYNAVEWRKVKHVAPSWVGQRVSTINDLTTPLNEFLREFM